MPATRQIVVDRHVSFRTHTVDPHYQPSRAHAWYACHTHSRSEKKAATLLERRGIKSYLPVVARERQWHDRKKVVSFPLFPSYVFARFNPGETLPVVTTPGVATLVRFDGRLAPISDEDIENIGRFARALSDNRLELPPAVQFHRDQRVRITSGPFEGIVGVVTEVRGRKRVLVGLQTIGLGFEVDVAADTLKSAS